MTCICGSPAHRDDAMNMRCNVCEHLVRMCKCEKRTETHVHYRTEYQIKENGRCSYDRCKYNVFNGEYPESSSNDTDTCVPRPSDDGYADACLIALRGIN